ncbi:MAG TPA: hypothetical protein VHY82_06155, partial [Acetobacteraceae bacterium]|nr:hypothetical protein [Acetobacteraceae bacterium]
RAAARLSKHGPQFSIERAQTMLFGWLCPLNLTLQTGIIEGELERGGRRRIRCRNGCCCAADG